jgi:uroporphyrinogen decarboxylase
MGTPQQVRDEAKPKHRCVRASGGFVFTPVHNIQANVPPANIEAAYETACEA